MGRPMRSTSFRAFIECEFANQLREYQRGSVDALNRLRIPGPARCEHHQVPHSLVVPLSRRVQILDTQETFWAAWYLTTLLHQAVHRYASNNEQEWIERFGAHPLPMVARGMGCWRVARPALLLDRFGEDVSMIMLACEYMRERIPKVLGESRINPSGLSVQILADRDIDLSHPIERLVGRSIAQWQITSV